ncbi:hypothetical protein MKX67_08950 [Cytobacillus sp. FSL W7-1323]|uniref:hypothetical protein n=1 Tax=Cytobacillus TaxID=2675230 RepID=UPI002E1C0F64|nr:hypothetical protein [Cytobacillus kochii]
MTMDFLDRLIDLLDIQNYYAPVVSPVTVNGNSIAVTTLPTRNYHYYMDGSFNQGYAFQVSAKHEKQMLAYNTIQEISQLMGKRGLIIPSQNDSYDFEGMEITTSPNLLMQDEKYYIFAATFNANLLVYKE